MPVPIDPFAGMPSFALPMSSAASAANYSTIAPSVLTPFNFDNSGWVVQIKGKGDLSAQGSTGANGGGLNSSPAGATTANRLNMLLIGGAVALWLLTRNS